MSIYFHFYYRHATQKINNNNHHNFFPSIWSQSGCWETFFMSCQPSLQMLQHSMVFRGLVPVSVCVWKSKSTRLTNWFNRKIVPHGMLPTNSKWKANKWYVWYIWRVYWHDEPTAKWRIKDEGWRMKILFIIGIYRSIYVYLLVSRISFAHGTWLDSVLNTMPCFLPISFFLSFLLFIIFCAKSSFTNQNKQHFNHLFIIQTLDWIKKNFVPFTL